MCYGGALPGDRISSSSFVCGCVGVGARFVTGLCAYVVGCPPHLDTREHTDTRPHVETNRKSYIHAHANTAIHPYTNPHKPTHPTQRHTHTHVHMLPVARPHAGVHWGGGTPDVRTSEGVHKGEICMNSHEFVPNLCEFDTNSCEFTPMNRLKACRSWHFSFWAPFGMADWSWLMRLGRDFQ